jgi:hypothetical protein
MNYKQLTKLIKHPDISVVEYFLLLNIYYNQEEEFLKDNSYNRKFQNLRELGFLALNNKLTLEGKNLIEFEIGKSDFLKKEETVKEKIPENYFDNLHTKLQDKLYNLTGKKQNMLQGKYAFLCNKSDLQKRLAKVIKDYKLKDLDKIEKILLNYVTKCVVTRFDKVHLIQYFIIKDGNSILATIYENYEENEVKDSIEDNPQPKSIKSLF